MQLTTILYGAVFLVLVWMELTRPSTWFAWVAIGLLGVVIMMRANMWAAARPGPFSIDTEAVTIRVMGKHRVPLSDVRGLIDEGPLLKLDIVKDGQEGTIRIPLNTTSASKEVVRSEFEKRLEAVNA